MKIELYHQHGVELLIEEDALQKMLHSAAHDPSLEAGGILLGKKKAGSACYCITDVGTPGILDRPGPFFFVRSRISAEKLVTRAWKKSGGTVNHIGEWHSHPFPSPLPSGQDRQDMDRAYREGEVLFPHFFTLIVSEDFRIFVGLVERGKIIDSQIIKTGGL